MMTPRQVFEKLHQLFPRYYAGKEGEAWAAEFGSQLKGIPGEKLEIAFNACMAGWVKASPPKPADIKAHMSAKRPGTLPSGYRHASTKEEADEWIAKHSYLEGLEDWQNVLVRG